MTDFLTNCSDYLRCYDAMKGKFPTAEAERKAAYCATAVRAELIAINRKKSAVGFLRRDLTKHFVELETLLMGSLRDGLR